MSVQYSPYTTKKSTIGSIKVQDCVGLTMIKHQNAVKIIITTPPKKEIINIKYGQE